MLDGWRSSERRRADGAIDSVQRALIARPAVEASEDGARSLGRRYWLEVRRASRGLVRPRERDGRVELRVLAFPPRLLTFGEPRLTVETHAVACLYEITGGVLARRPGGTVSLAQSSAGRPELSVAVEGFSPRLGVLYGPVHRRFHVLVSRRYFRRLLAETQR